METREAAGAGFLPAACGGSRLASRVRSRSSSNTSSCRQNDLSRRSSGGRHRRFVGSRGPLFGAATLQLPQWVQNLSPFTHIPKAPAADVTAVPVVSLQAISAVLTVAGLVAFRRRNFALPV